LFPLPELACAACVAFGQFVATYFVPTSHRQLLDSLIRIRKGRPQQPREAGRRGDIRANDRVFLYAFDLIELNGDDLRHDPLEGRKATPEMILAKAGAGIWFNEHIEGDGPTVFAHACKLGLEDIVSKRKDSAYRSGRSPDWLKMKNSMRRP
jgi:hypothetical protein